MIRPWYCSGLFWSGLIVAAFVVWAWWDSDQAMSLATISQRDGGLMVAQSQGAIIVMDRGGLSFSNIKRFEAHREPGAWIDRESKVVKLLGLSWPVPFESDLVGDPPIRARFSFLAWWVVLAGHLIVWAGSLVFWQRRKRRKAAAHLVPAD